MYAIIQTGGKQYQVEEGDTIEVELLNAESDTIEFNEVLFLNDGQAICVGTPHVEGCSVKGKVIGDKKGAKVISFKYKRRKNFHRKVGHRQNYSVVKITAIARS